MTPDQEIYRAFCMGVLYARAVAQHALIKHAELEPRKTFAQELVEHAEHIGKIPTPDASLSDLIIPIVRMSATDAAASLAAMVAAAVAGIDSGADDVRQRRAESS